MSQDMRGKGMAVHILISNFAGFINTFANSVGLGKLGWKYYFVFVGWDLVASVLWFLLGVETVRLVTIKLLQMCDSDGQEQNFLDKAFVADQFCLSLLRPVYL